MRVQPIGCKKEKPGLRFFWKQSKHEGNELQCVYLRIVVDGIPREVFAKQLCEPFRWSSLPEGLPKEALQELDPLLTIAW
jgi:hypothetical protein